MADHDNPTSRSRVLPRWRVLAAGAAVAAAGLGGALRLPAHAQGPRRGG